MDQQLSCPRCGNQLQYPSDRCQFCGAVFQQAWTVPQPAYPQLSAQPVDQRNIRWTPLRFVPPVLLAVALLILLIEVFRGGAHTSNTIFAIYFLVPMVAAIWLSLVRSKAAVVVAGAVAAMFLWSLVYEEMRSDSYDDNSFGSVLHDFFHYVPAWLWVVMLLLLIGAVLLFVVFNIQRNPRSWPGRYAPMTAPMPMAVPMAAQPVQPYAAPSFAGSTVVSAASAPVAPQPGTATNASLCSKCGAALLADDQFCGECGSQI